jgi:Glycosyltransferase like family
MGAVVKCHGEYFECCMRVFSQLFRKRRIVQCDAWNKRRSRVARTLLREYNSNEAIRQRKRKRAFPSCRVEIPRHIAGAIYATYTRSMNASTINVEIVAATRRKGQDFLSNSALGLSLRRTAWDLRIKNFIELENTKPLPTIYNRSINADRDDAILVFVHDDVWLDDFHLAARLVDALNVFDVVGVAGNLHAADGHVGWAFTSESLAWDKPDNLSGAVGHGEQPFGAVSAFGPTPTRCELLDGMFLAAKRSVLRAANVLFDPQFDFHFYDLDFCRTAAAAGLHIGTWPISMTHQSAGKFGSAEWRQRLTRYREKWAR